MPSFGEIIIGSLVLLIITTVLITKRPLKFALNILGCSAMLDTTIEQRTNKCTDHPENALNPNQSANNPSISPNCDQNTRHAPPQKSFNQTIVINQNNDNNNRTYHNNKMGRNDAFNKNLNEDNIQPISSLNLYQNSWKIKVRCKHKNNMRLYGTKKGAGKYFDVHLLDKQGTEIRAVAFNEAADKFFTIFETNRVFLISKGRVQLVSKQYCRLKNDYEIKLHVDSIVVPVDDNNNDFDQQKYQFVTIAQIQQVKPESFVDVIGVIINVGPISTVMSKKKKNRKTLKFKRRNIEIADETGKIDVTLWNKDAEDFNRDKLGKNRIIALKGCKVSEFAGRSLSSTGSIDFHPDTSETNHLLTWINKLSG